MEVLQLKGTTNFLRDFWDICGGSAKKIEYVGGGRRKKNAGGGVLSANKLENVRGVGEIFHSAPLRTVQV